MADGEFYLGEFHTRWFRDHMGKDVHIEDVLDSVNRFSVNGSKAREVLERVTDTDLSGLKMVSCKIADLSLREIGFNAMLSMRLEKSIGI